ncbi:3-hydroxyanthranilate 3,4-dioxygenase [Pedococcus sp. 5OH_020]|uniref:3-hydroxyanthranilate 3,4-dioxygenase n=1 Tax=Pedococcus sp. 5OH_020 TaxID=2989814 RepID=UPI0022EA07A2|nr:3-hydroxyanthranilate 3,4-dioxygenase [Pedococcus sp. 5OH_020]
MSTIPPVTNFPQWVKDNEHLLKPPVNNKQALEPMDDFIVQVVGGPNQRTDFHYDPFEEWFYQVKGSMHVNLMTEDGPRRVDIHEGDMWMLPRNTFHSPQRPEAGSIGIVIERIREEGELEKFAWFCPQCNTKVHEVELQVRDIVQDLPPVFQQFYTSEEGRTCPSCGTVHPGKG